MPVARKNLNRCRIVHSLASGSGLDGFRSMVRARSLRHFYNTICIKTPALYDPARAIWREWHAGCTRQGGPLVYALSTFVSLAFVFRERLQDRHDPVGLAKWSVCQPVKRWLIETCRRPSRRIRVNTSFGDPVRTRRGVSGCDFCIPGSEGHEGSLGGGFLTHGLGTAAQVPTCRDSASRRGCLSPSWVIFGGWGDCPNERAWNLGGTESNVRVRQIGG